MSASGARPSPTEATAETDERQWRSSIADRVEDETDERQWRSSIAD